MDIAPPCILAANIIKRGCFTGRRNKHNKLDRKGDGNGCFLFCPQAILFMLRCALRYRNFCANLRITSLNAGVVRAVNTSFARSPRPSRWRTSVFMKGARKKGYIVGRTRRIETQRRARSCIRNYTTRVSYTAVARDNFAVV